MDESDVSRYSDEECLELLDRLFPSGPAGQDVLRELAPQGWESSPLRFVFHPTVEQVFEESVRIHENIRKLGRPDPQNPCRPAPTLEEVTASYAQTPVEPQRECAELVARCLWDVLSDNHEVIGSDGRIVDLGSFRGSAGTIADWLNGRMARASYDYMDFYMGTIWVSGRADLSPVYQLIFRRLRSDGLDWRYSFPRLHLVDLSGLHERAAEESEDFSGYDPSRSLEAEQEEQRRQESMAQLRADLDEAHQKAIEEAASTPPPVTVAAYRSVYGHFPQGWPPNAGE